jgi:hypothetical protein
LASGADPMAERKAEAEAKQKEVEARQRESATSFENVARDWWAWWSIGKSHRHAETVMNRLEADVFPVLGHLFIDAVEPGQIRNILVTVEERGAMEANLRQIHHYVENSLMLVTALTQHIGYDKAAKLAKTAHHQGLSLREANRELGFLTEEEFDKYLRPEKITGPEVDQ